MKNDKNYLWYSLKLAFELGYTIAIPLVVLGLGGRYLDKYLDSSPLFLIIGIIFSIIVSSISIYIKTVKILKQFDSEIKENNQKKDGGEKN